ncbi:sporulation related protein [Palleronia aestuarii]|uniref:Sporulation related protein n=1 Tax=Palleronia aestuarii TaxID=568105 RepID=A0A2W7N7G6_9RHOB|nr:SPOR domain-containing protein [Palleronia aestuarii]PZX16008.1 sporulation related protein [Palleronia aestuarii]
MTHHEIGLNGYPVGHGLAFQRLANVSGALVSVALIAGLGTWGYNLLVRDVTGVPVIQAMEGAFRIAPEEPGGMNTPHQGLAVNEIAAEGGATGPADTVTLAPPPVDLASEDRPAADLRAEMAREAEAVAEIARAETAALSDSATDRTETLPEAETVAESGIIIDDTPGDASPTDMAVAEALAGAFEPEAVVTNASLGGAISPRPEPRPGSQQASVPSPSIAQPRVDPSEAPEIAAASIAPGTRLAQLGAYPDARMARAEWNRIGESFAEYFGGKRRVVQEVTTGGRTFYRLRAEGFADLAEARRFCSALAAGNAECIPVEFR